MYEWRKMSDDERREELSFRKDSAHPRHSPPHSKEEGWNRYHLTATNFEHAVIIGKSTDRMRTFSDELCSALSLGGDSAIYAWSVLPNHWHALVGCGELKELMEQLRLLHGRSSHTWNGEDCVHGRKCWYCTTDRRIRSDRHFYATRNYINNNPVKHGYVDKWREWEFSSATHYLDEVGDEEAARFWREYPVLDMGEKWDL